MPLQRPRALVVDKDTAETQALRRMLEEQGFEVNWAKDGEQAYNVLDAPPPDKAGAAAQGHEVVIAELDMDMIEEVRRVWQFYRDRRPETYEDMVDLLP